MFNKLKQFKDIRSKAKTIQSQLAQEKVEGSAMWGKIKVEMDGNMSVTDITISDELLSEKRKLEAGMKDAFNDAVKRAQRKMAEQMKEMGGLDGLGMG